MNQKLRKILQALIITIFWLAIWEIVSLIVGKDILVPSPVSVFVRLISLIVTGSFWAQIGVTFLRILVGYLAAIIAGTLLGAATAFARILDAFLEPVARIIRATPVVSFILLLFVFAARDNIPAITSFLMVLPVVWANVHEGVKSADRAALEMAKVYKVPGKRVFLKIYVPAVLPFFLTAVKTGMGLAWKSGVAAEAIVNPQYGIGTMIHDSKIYLETTDLFAWTVVIIVLSVILEKALVRVVSKYNEKSK